MKIQAVRGMNDILPPETRSWQLLENILRQTISQYGYQECRLPLMESTDLFKRSIGEVTDIVEKEMYTFADNNGDSLTLRPEGTAGCVRAAIEHGLLHHQMQRLWYMGPMFRHERPQKGRYRQFHQCGVETFGMADPQIDVELILLSARLWRLLGIEKYVSLQINSLGDKDARASHRAALVAYLETHRADLDADSLHRLTRNPLRILDSKNPVMQTVIAGAPQLLDYCDDAARIHFESITTALSAADISYEINPRLVRGLDYYNRTVFEWVTDQLGAQGTVCAGGRYDSLVSLLGGRETPAVGFAIGLERILALMALQENVVENRVDYYIISDPASTRVSALLLAESIRNTCASAVVLVDCGEGGFKNQLKRASQQAAKMAIIIGENEMQTETLTLKELISGEQSSVAREAFLKSIGV